MRSQEPLGEHEIVRFSSFYVIPLAIILLGGTYVIVFKQLPVHVKNGQDLAIVKDLVIIIGCQIILFVFSTLRLVLKPEGHYGILAFTWQGAAKWVFYMTPLRRWKDCLVELDMGAPFYPLNIRETHFHLPILMKYFHANYSRACAYILKHGMEAKITPRALEHLRREAKKAGAG